MAGQSRAQQAKRARRGRRPRARQEPDIPMAVWRARTALPYGPIYYLNANPGKAAGSGKYSESKSRW